MHSKARASIESSMPTRACRAHKQQHSNIVKM